MLDNLKIDTYNTLIKLLLKRVLKRVLKRRAKILKSVGNSILVKQININIVREALKKQQYATKQKLSEITGLSIVTIQSVLKYLIEKREVFEDTLIPSNGGRPALQFCYNNNFSYALLLYAHQCDSKDMVYACVVNLLGKVICKEKLILNEISIENLEKIIHNFFEKYTAIAAIGFGMPAVESEGVIMVDDYNTIYGTRFTQHFTQKYEVPVLFENDVNAAVAGYYHLNAIKNCACIVYLYFPQKYPPGAGIFINGKLYKGYANFAGEIKNIPLGIDWNTLDYNNFDEICNAVLKLILSIISVLNPEIIVLSGDFLTMSHVQVFDKQCKKNLSDVFMPKIFLSNQFNSDFEVGMIQNTLDLLKPKLLLVE